MILAKLMSDIVNNELKSVYIFTGDDRTIMDVYLQQIKERYKYEYVSCNEVSEVIRMNRHKSIINKPNKRMFVVRDDKSFLTQEEGWGWLLANKNNLIILIYGVIDSRLKFNTTFENNLVTFDAMNTETLVKHIVNKGIENSRYAEIIATYTGNNYGWAMLEVDKVLNYARATDKSSEAAFTELYHRGIIGGDDTFSSRDYIDGLFNKNAEVAYGNINEEENLKYLSTIYTHARSLYLVKSYGSREDIGKETGLSNGQIYFYRNNAGKFGMKQLLQIMTLVQSIESGIKKGTIPSEIALTYLTAKVFNL